MQERPRRGDDVYGVALPDHIKLIERLLWRFRLAFTVAKSREVVLADQFLRGIMHRICVEGAWQPPGTADLKRQIGAAIGNSITIVPADGGEARLECIRHDLRGQHADRMRPQMRVETIAKPSRDEMPGNVAMRDLGQRVHTGIGAAGAVNADVLAADRLHRLFKRTLNRRAVFLDLPATERRAVIFNHQFVAGHQLSRAGRLSGVPRRNSSAFIGALPARCSSRIRMAPSLHATARRSSSNSPGAPKPSSVKPSSVKPSAIAQRRTLTRAGSPSIGISHHAPGNGDSP